ncbi:MAG: putative sulfate exporter family transporter, partial [Nitrospirae bacterium]
MSGRLIGLISPISIAIIATSLSYLHPSFEALAISIILGMLFSNLLEERTSLNEGAGLIIRIFLPLGIALYGLQLHIGKPDTRIILPVLATYSMIFG